MEPTKTMKVLLVEPDKAPQVIEMPNTLKALQTAVGGNIEVIYPYDDMVGLVCNEEGKINSSPLNRAVYGEDNLVIDIIAGNFLVVGLSEDKFTSLTPVQQQKFKKVFRYPEVFVNLNGKIKAIPKPRPTPKKEKEL